MNLLNYCLLFLSSFLINDNPKLTIKVQNIESIKGKIIIGVFNTDKDFLKEGVAIKKYSIVVDEPSESIIIDDLPKGDYAISLYHDENSDNECNRNFMGIPKEPYGFSNNVQPKFSAPSFNECKFNLSKNMVLNIKLLTY